MPELPDILLYLDALAPRVVGKRIERIRITSPFFVRSYDPEIDTAEGKAIARLRRLGKRIVFELEDDLFLVLHLMIAGQMRWREQANAKLGSKTMLAAFDFQDGTLLFAEAATKKRASLHLLCGESNLDAHRPNGLEVLGSQRAAFRDMLLKENHTLKRALTDPNLFSGIGNTYSDEILHAARLSLLKLTSRLSDDEIERLHQATVETLGHWVKQLKQQFADRFPGPGDITALRPEFAAHGKFGQPCRDCSTPIQRIRYAENETNYCPRCQTEGKILADRSLSRLLKKDWPRDIG